MVLRALDRLGLSARARSPMKAWLVVIAWRPATMLEAVPAGTERWLLSLGRAWPSYLVRKDPHPSFCSPSRSRTPALFFGVGKVTHPGPYVPCFETRAAMCCFS